MKSLPPFVIKCVTNGGLFLPNFIFYCFNSPVDCPFAAIQLRRNVGIVHPAPPQIKYGVFVICQVKAQVIVGFAAHSEVKLTSHCRHLQ